MDMEAWSFGSMRALYMEYVRRTEPYTMQIDHFHPFYEIYYLLSGSRIYFVQDRTYTVEAGDLVFISPNVLHKTLQSRDPGHERFVIHFDDAYAGQQFGGHAKLLLEPFRQASPVLRLPPAEQRTADRIVRRAIDEIRLKPPGYELVPPRALTDLLLLAGRYVRDFPLSAAEDDRSPKIAKISDVVRHINGHYGEPLKLGELAERFYVSPYHLSRTFKEVTGFTFSDYIALTRIKEAQRLLRDTDRSVADIAIATGFDNFSHFGKTFKKIARRSPRDFRRESRL
ncbi:helix-turn-helix transcriptional regulator [Cohnella zeiphila]|uniref:Helix-turn-helix transcriptional regulator n=1 Tax=Cohnella zeiphila TaxID=2761120 RepID=A0A7X0SPN7_9BACL|nr:helix-turn-helix domain-containing protein [Cohnella zeiphila]MBB6733786.1 helix-turn-helix transcriptional regulator [Cohnella zeiphila]